MTNIDYNTSPDITLKYDALSRLTNMADAVGTTVYAYDTVGQLLSEDGPWSSDTVSYTYDNARRRGGLTLSAPNASTWSQSYGYDTASRMTNLTSSTGAFTYAYDATRKLQVNKLTLPNTAYITNTFDSVARLTGTYLKNSGNTNLNYHTYAYNLGSQRTQQGFTASNYVDYTYDNLGQLKTAKGKESGGTTNRLPEQMSYVYDAAGNLNWRTNNALIQAFNVNNLNELTTATNTRTLTVAGTTTSAATNVTVNTSNAALYLDNTFAKDGFTVTNGNNTFKAIVRDNYGRSDTNTISVTLSNSVPYTYDLNGNLLYDGSRAFDYDDENQLTRVTVTNQWKSEFTYDGQMRRRMRKEFTWSGSWVQTNEVRYICDGGLVIQERDANNLPTVSYTRGRDSSDSLQGAGGIGGLLARTDHSTQLTVHYHADGNGNVTALINAQQLVVAKYLYDAFGITLSMSGSLADANLYRFSSKEYQPNSGLIYFGRRFYDPNLQRWLNQDPISERGGANLYEFNRNNPIRYGDAYGEGPLDWVLTGSWNPSPASWEGWKEGYLSTGSSRAALSIGESAGGSLAYLFDSLPFVGDQNLRASELQQVENSQSSSVLGQTDCGPAWAKYGVRGALGISAAAVTIAGGAGVLNAAGVPTMSIGWASTAEGTHVIWGVTAAEGTTILHIGGGIMGGSGAIAPEVYWGYLGGNTAITGIPIFFSEAASTTGIVGYNCLTGACAALRRGIFGF